MIVSPLQGTIVMVKLLGLWTSCIAWDEKGPVNDQFVPSCGMFSFWKTSGTKDDPTAGIKENCIIRR